MAIRVVDQKSLNDAIDNFKNDQCDVNWLLVNHADSADLIQLVGSGSGGLEELLLLVEENNISYGYLRINEVVEISNTVKFVLLHFIGEQVSLVRQGRYGIKKGEIVSTYFQPHHVAIENISNKEVTLEDIQQKVANASGTAKHELDSTVGKQYRSFTGKPSFQDSKHISSAPSLTPQYKDIVSTPTQSVNLIFTEELRDAVSEIRDDANPIQFLIACYKNNDPKTNTLELFKKSSESINEFLSNFEESLALYGFLRSSDIYDKIATVKFVYISWTGEKVNASARAFTTIHKGACRDFFEPHHINFQAANISDITEEKIKAKIQEASGSKMNVRQ